MEVTWELEKLIAFNDQGITCMLSLLRCYYIQDTINVKGKAKRCKRKHAFKMFAYSTGKKLFHKASINTMY